MSKNRTNLLPRAESDVNRQGSAEPSANGKHSPPKPWAIKTTDDIGAGWNGAELMDKEFPPAKYAVDGLLVEGLTILGGRPKQGKSWLSLLIAWAVAAGYELDGRAVQEGKVLYLALEDTPRRLKERMLMLNAAFGWEKPAGLTIYTRWPRGDDAGLFRIADWLDAQKGAARLVVVDTMARFRKPQKGNGNSYAEDYDAFGELQQLFLHYEVAGLTNHHTRKLHAEDPFDELSGTMGVSGAVDSMWVLERTRGEAGGELFVTGRDLPEGTVPMAFSRSDCRWKLGGVKAGIDTSARSASPAAGKLDQCKEWLKDFLREYAYPSKEIEVAGRAAGFAPTTLRDAKVALGAKGTGEIVNHNFGFGTQNDWWSGVGECGTWKRRPVQAPKEPNRESESREDDEPEPIEM